MIFFLLSLGLASADCTPPKATSSDAFLQARAQARGHVSIEIPLIGNANSPEDLLAILNERNVQVTLLPSRQWANRNPRVLREAIEAGHEVGVWFSLRDDLGLTADRITVPRFSEWVGALRTSRKHIRRVTGTNPSTVAIAYLPAAAEVAIEAMGFRMILPSERTVGDLPRRSQSASSSSGRARIVGEGPYEDGCGSLLPHWSPASFDRATGAVARGQWVRVGLPTAQANPSLLQRWLDEVVEPFDWPIVTASEMSKLIRRLPTDTNAQVPDIAVAKSVDQATWRQVATHITDSSTLPRSPADGLNLTETFYGFVTLLGTDPTPTSVTLGRLEGPSEVAPTGLHSPIDVDPTDVRAAAKAIRSRMGGRVPALLTMGGVTLTAAEALQLFARVYLGQKATAQPVTDPDPYAPGGGWGESKGL